MNKSTTKWEVLTMGTNYVVSRQTIRVRGKTVFKHYRENGSVPVFVDRDVAQQLADRLNKEGVNQ